jgi:hypothetical protein
MYELLQSMSLYSLYKCMVRLKSISNELSSIKLRLLVFHKYSDGIQHVTQICQDDIITN